MLILDRLVHRLGRLFRRRRAEAEMAEEMRFHLEQRAADYAADGLGSDEARLAAQRRFGNLGSLQEQSREAWGWGAWERAWKDVLLAFRHLQRSPGFSLLAIVTLGLGIGANTAMFSVLNTVMLRPLPYANPGELDHLVRSTPQDPEGGVSPADFLAFQRDAAAGYGEVAAYVPADVSLSEPGEAAELVNAVRVSANLFTLLGIPPAQGRAFVSGDDQPGQDRVVVLSERTWKHRFGARPDIVGTLIRVDGIPHEIIGVLPGAFNDWRHLGWVDLFRPLGLSPEHAADRRSTQVRLVGRRAAGLSPAESAAAVARFGEHQAAEFTELHAHSSWRALPMEETVVSNNGSDTLMMLIGLSAFVLLIACSNLANLLLARTLGRAREFAVRSALGASRSQLLRPLLAESLLLSLAGGAFALILAAWATDWLSVRTTGDNGERLTFSLDPAVLGWAFGASLVTAVVFGLAPALFALRLDLNHALKSGGRGTTGGRGHRHFRSLLIVGQFALALVLLSGAALFVRGLDHLNQRRSGWSSDQLVSGSLLLPAGTYADAESISAFQRRVLERLSVLPGVASASLASFLPYFNWPDTRRFLIAGQAPMESGKEPAAVVNGISPRYFETVGTRLIAGRDFSPQDSLDSPRVFIINETMAHALFGEANPIGRRLSEAGDHAPVWGEIVGVVGNVVSTLPDSTPVASQLYHPMAQQPRARFEIAVRAAGRSPEALISLVRSAMTELDPDLPVRRLKSADAIIHRANYQLGVLRDMLVSFALLGLGLASLGIYGVIARTTALRTEEFAIRLALGATGRDILRLVLRSGVTLALVGSTLGLVGALAVSRLLIAGFPGIPFQQAPVLLGATLVLFGIALFASWLPARRASRIHAVAALRGD